jgi:membrane protein insertase Oxa1/YidC/SpoIIIJ
MWNAFVDILRALIFSAAHMCGGSLGGGVVLVSAGARIALLPLTLRMARQARDQQRRLADLKPALDALQKRFANDPVRLYSETKALHAKNGIRMLTPTGFLSFGVQLPLLSGLFAAVRRGLGSRVAFLWIGDLARPDMLLLGGAAALTGISIATAPAIPGAPPTPGFVWILGMIATAFFLRSSPSTVMLSMGTGSLVTMLQNWLLAREDIARRSVPVSAPRPPHLKP